jgi:type II secretory pathway pseudopilin PulG
VIGRSVHGQAERGETLVELLVTIVIMGAAFVAILAGVGVAIASSDSHRQEATAEGVLRSYAERIQDSRDVLYVDCATTSAYASPAGFAEPPGWTISLTNVAYLQTDNSYGGACPSPDRGAQQLTLLAVSPHDKNGASETLVVVKRRS